MSSSSSVLNRSSETDAKDLVVACPGSSSSSIRFMVSESSLRDWPISKGFSSKSSSSVSRFGISSAGFSSSLISFLVMSTISSWPDWISSLVKASISFKASPSLLESIEVTDDVDERRSAFLLLDPWSRYLGMNLLKFGRQGSEMRRLRTSRFPSAMPRSQRSSTLPFLRSSMCFAQQNRSVKAAQLFRWLGRKIVVTSCVRVFSAAAISMKVVIASAAVSEPRSRKTSSSGMIPSGSPLSATSSSSFSATTPSRRPSGEEALMVRSNSFTSSVSTASMAACSSQASRKGDRASSTVSADSLGWSPSP
mmetsp:Transcript_7393/g.18081  ORF Transcript_7393/g.18081 Transcript_7393/m.18081 type:complete len:308 (-) Transcript_7393:1850-2773(-)